MKVRLLVSAMWLLLFIPLNVQGQIEPKSIWVDGICGMCKDRIEKASIKTKGVKSAVWNVKTHELKLIFDERKTDLKTIQKNIVAVGHDTKEMKATDEAYNSVHPCCKYRDKEIVKDHKNE